MTKKEQNIIDRLNEIIQNDGVSNAFLVQLIELAGTYLNLKTIPDYAQENKLSYNGAKKFRTIQEIFNVKFVIDND